MFAKIILAANETQVLDATNAEQGILSGCVASANQYSAATKDNWVLLSPYGVFPNAVGDQHFTQDDAQAICNEFDSAPNTGVRTLGLPWYVGHPDHPAFKSQHTDTSAKGRIKELEARADGLWANVKWNDEGKTLIANQSYHGHSTNWRMRKDARGEFHPFSLKSVGFTNEPGIPVPAITAANQKGKIMTQAEIDAANAKAKGPKLTDYIAKLLGKPEIAANEDDSDAISGMEGYAANAAAQAKELNDLKTEHGNLKAAHQVLSTMHDAVVKKYGCCNEKNEVVIPEATVTELAANEFKMPEADVVPALAAFVIEKSKALKAKDGELVAANSKISTMETDAANARKATDDALLGVLTVGGFITGAERISYAADLAANEKREATVKALLALKPKINVVSATGSLGHVSAAIVEAQNEAAAKANKTEAIVEAVNELQADYAKKNPGKRLDYMKAHATVCRTRPELFTSSETTITR